MGIVQSRVITWVAIVAALIYNSWPFGYLLNSRVARVGLSSDLEAYGQPYAWFFVSGDVLCGLLITGEVLYLFRGRVLHSLRADLLALGMSFLGLMTAASALVPLHCGSDIQTCGYQAGQSLGAHDVMGAIAAFGLFVAMFTAWWLSVENMKLNVISGVTLLLWSIWGLAFLLTPLSYVQSFHEIQALAVIWQQIFLILSGVGIVLSMRSLQWLVSREE
jgi:hypothetical protein